MRVLRLIVATLLLPACAASAAIPCPPRASVPRGWATINDETGEWQLRMPRSFQPAPGKFVFIHGGQTWQRGEATVSISFGHWAEYSFRELPGDRCRVRIGDANVFVIAGPKSIIAWYDRGSGGHEPLVNVSSPDPAELAKLAPIALSLRAR